MLLVILIALALPFTAIDARAQINLEVSYGFDRNVDSPPAEFDGWLNATVEWMFPSGLGLGIGTDHHFENASINTSDHEGWAIYVAASREFPFGRVAPFLRGGLGLGRAPCVGDTCSDGVYVRGSTGLRVRLTKQLGVSGEIGVSRVSRPFAGAGVWVRI